MRMRRAALVATCSWAWALACVACERGTPKLDDDPKVAAVHEATAALRAGPIGPDQGDVSSYALVDVENTSAQDRLIAVEGELLGADGKPAATLGADEMRVPAHEARTFALVADKRAAEAAKA